MVEYRAHIKRNPIQVLHSCVPGCFRLAQKRFVRIEDVEGRNRNDPVTLASPEVVPGFSINEISWRNIWNHIRSSYPPEVLRVGVLLPVVEENQFVGRISRHDSMDWCHRHWDYYPKGSHQEPPKVIRPIRYMQNPARVPVHLVPEFSSVSTLYQILTEDEDVRLPDRNKILTLFSSNPDMFDSLVGAILDRQSHKSQLVIVEWLKSCGHEEQDDLCALIERMGDSFQRMIDWVLDKLQGENLKDITHSSRIAKGQGDLIYESNHISIVYSTDMNIIRYAFDVARYPYRTKPHPTTGDRPNVSFSKMQLPFKWKGIDCIATSSKVECLVICFGKKVENIVAHTYLHALTKHLSQDFGVSEEVFNHHIDKHFSLLFVDQPLNLGLLAEIDESRFKKFHHEMCDGENHCIDLGACPGACHHCLHYPYYMCSKPDDMTKMSWRLLGSIQW